MTWDAVVLAGGRATRLGGVDKPALLQGGRSLLDRALAATSDARSRVVVGPARPAPAGVRFVLEEPRFGGPVAAVAAGLAALAGDAPLVAVLAADLPAVEAALPRLLAVARMGRAGRVGERADADGWVGADPDGRDQPLLAVYRSAALAAALAALAAARGGLDGAALRALLAPLPLTRVPLPVALCADVDDPEDARRAGIPLPPVPPLEHA